MRSPIRSRGTRRTIAVALAAAFLMSIAFAGTASANNPNLHKLFSENLGELEGDDGDFDDPCPAATDQWINTNSAGNRDSPLDSNIKSYKLVVPANCYIAVASLFSINNLDIPVGNVKNISFDVRTPQSATPGTIAGGSPRITVFLDNGDKIDMDAANCMRPIASTGGDWARSDFTGALASDGVCTIYENNSIAHTNTATTSAWQVMAAANPGTSLTYSFFIVDQPGTYYVDRIALGTQKLYSQGDFPAKSCTTEGSC